VEKTTYRGALFSVLLTKYSGDQIKKDEMGWACSTYVVEEKCVWGLVERPEERRPLNRHRPRWDDNIKVDLSKEGRHGLDYSDLE
jgi:hypothetical protein